MTTIILYIAVGLFLLGGLYVRAWFFIDFRSKIGNTKFFISTLMEIVAFMVAIYLIDLDFSWTLKLIGIGLLFAGNLLFSICIYTREDRLNKPIEADRG